MNVNDILNNTPHRLHSALLAELIEQAFIEDGKINEDQDVNGGDLTETFCNRVIALIAEARKNIATAQAENLNNIEDIELDGYIHDSFSSRASDINNQGKEEQIRYLIVENGMTPEQIEQNAE